MSRPKDPCVICGERKNHNNHTGDTWLHDFESSKRQGQRRRGSTVPQQSDRRKVAQRELTPVKQQRVADHPNCEAALEDICTRQSFDADHVLPRGRSGSDEDLTEYENLRALCRACHDWLGEHPKEAANLGMRLHAWDQRPWHEGAA